MDYFSHNRWRNPSEKLVIKNGEIHVWLVTLEVDLPIIQNLRLILAKDERKRADRFHFQKHRNRFTVARGLLRVTLGRYLNTDPMELKFDYNNYGKPFLAEQLSGDQLQFNVSHSHTLALYAMTLNQPLGVDIERIRPDFAELKIAQRFFSAGEVKVLKSLPVNVQKEAFFNCWTRKEAFIKATGKGLSMPLSQFDVSLTPNERAALLKVNNDPHEASRWSLYNLETEPGYKAAMAVEGHHWQIKCWKWTVENIRKLLLNVPISATQAS